MWQGVIGKMNIFIASRLDKEESGTYKYLYAVKSSALSSFLLKKDLFYLLRHFLKMCRENFILKNDVFCKAVVIRLRRL